MKLRRIIVILVLAVLAACTPHTPPVETRFVLSPELQTIADLSPTPPSANEKRKDALIMGIVMVCYAVAVTIGQWGHKKKEKELLSLFRANSIPTLGV